MQQIKTLLFATVIILCGICLLTPKNAAIGDEVDDLNQQLDQTQQQLKDTISEKDVTQSRLQELEQMKQQFKGSLDSLQNNYALTQTQLQITAETIAEKETEINEIAAEIQQVEAEINHDVELIQQMIRQMYTSQTPGWLNNIYASQTIADFIQNMLYRSLITNNIQQELTQLKTELKTIKEIKALMEQIRVELENERNALVSQKNSLESEMTITQQQIQSAQYEIQNLNKALIGLDRQISELTQKQQAILAAKAAAALASTSVGNEEISKSAIEKDPPPDGNVYASFWTYGYPHRVGMSQYGAFGRAKAGQSAAQILQAYYSGVKIETREMPAKIKITTGSGTKQIQFEGDYLLGIGEMPSCWGAPDRGGIEALKAQAIAARTYALAYTDNGKNPICTTQSCQVYVGSSKVTGTCGEYWQQAVEETTGQIIIYNGDPITAWYASTAGGFTLSSAAVWGGHKPYVTGIADFDGAGNAYDGEKYGDSPWYHKAWGDEPWLSISQIADLFNAALLPEEYDDYVSQPERGGWNAEEVVNKLTELEIEPVTELTALEILDANGNSGANTAENGHVRAYYGTGKIVDIEASRFKFVYNLRSPGTDAIWTTRFDIITAAEL